MRKLLLLVAVLVLLAVVVLYTAPADIAYRFAANRIGALRADGISGSVWSGSARELSARGQALGAVHWELDRIAALRGRVQGDVVLNGKDTAGRATIAGQGRDYTVTNVSGRFPAPLLGPALDIPALVLGGNVVLDVPRLTLRDGYIAQVQGQATWTDLSIGGITAAAVPGLRAEFETRGAQVVGTIADLGGGVAIAGTVILEQNRFHTQVQINLREPNAALEEVLKFIGERTADGGSLLKVDGEMKRLY